MQICAVLDRITDVMIQTEGGEWLYRGPPKEDEFDAFMFENGTRFFGLEIYHSIVGSEYNGSARFKNTEAGRNTFFQFVFNLMIRTNTYGTQCYFMTDANMVEGTIFTYANTVQSLATRIQDKPGEVKRDTNIMNAFDFTKPILVYMFDEDTTAPKIKQYNVMFSKELHGFPLYKDGHKTQGD